MTTYRLKDEGYSAFKKIMRGRDWVGRVCKHAEGGYYARIDLRAKGGGMFEALGPTEVGAFEEAAARAMGYPSAAVLRARNSQVRARKRAYNAVADAVGRELFAGDVRHQMDVIDRVGATPEGFKLLLDAATRQFRRKA